MAFCRQSCDIYDISYMMITHTYIAVAPVSSAMHSSRPRHCRSAFYFLNEGSRPRTRLHTRTHTPATHATPTAASCTLHARPRMHVHARRPPPTHTHTLSHVLEAEPAARRTRAQLLVLRGDLAPQRRRAAAPPQQLQLQAQAAPRHGRQLSCSLGAQRDNLLGCMHGGHTRTRTQTRDLRWTTTREQVDALLTRHATHMQLRN